MSNTPDVTVIVLQWGRAAETVRCLDALLKSVQVAFDVVVIDNASPEPGAVATVRKAHPEVRIVENSRNLGYAGGNNVVLRKLVDDRMKGQGPRYAFLLNNDVEVAPDCLGRLVAAARGKRAAAVGAVNVIRGTQEYGSSGGFIKWPGGTYRDATEAAVGTGREVFEVGTLSGSTLLLDLETLGVTGVLDPDYFLVYEETDLCERIRGRKGKLYLVTAARAEHAVGASTEQKIHFYFRFRNRIRFVRKHGPRFGALLMMPAYLAEVAWKTVTYPFMGRKGDVGGIWRGVMDGLRGVTGPGPYM